MNATSIETTKSIDCLKVQLRDTEASVSPYLPLPVLSNIILDGEEDEVFLERRKREKLDLINASNNHTVWENEKSTYIGLLQAQIDSLLVVVTPPPKVYDETQSTSGQGKRITNVELMTLFKRIERQQLHFFKLILEKLDVDTSLMLVDVIDEE